ncbi:MAG: hypothetical protein RMJ05_09965 [Thermomicrobium sp.]|nr:hypothetical protein [Thermomicrobium sp.]
MRVVLSIVVPTYRRPASFLRLCTSVERFAPPGTELIAIIQSPDTIPPAGVRVYWAHPGYPGPHRHRGAQMARGDFLLFLDDDHELLPTFSAAWPQLQVLAAEPALVSLPLRDGLPLQPRGGVVALSGGMLVTRAVYERVGGFGTDYLDDIEFCLRCRWAGIPVRRAPVVSRHITAASLVG